MKKGEGTQTTAWRWPGGKGAGRWERVEGEGGKWGEKDWLRQWEHYRVRMVLLSCAPETCMGLLTYAIPRNPIKKKEVPIRDKATGQEL